MPATNTTACPKGPLARRVDAPAVVLCNAPKTPCWNGVLPAAPLLMHALMSPRLWPFLALYVLLGTPMLHAAEPVSDILSTGAQSAEAGQAAQAEVDRLEELATREGSLNLLADRIAVAEQALARARAARGEAQRRWRRALEHRGLPPTLTPREVRQIAAHRHALLALEDDRHRLSEEARVKRAEVAAAARRIDELLVACGLAPEAGPLDHLRLLQERLDAEKATVRRRAALARRLEVARRRHRHAKRQVRVAERGVREFYVRWSVATEQEFLAKVDRRPEHEVARREAEMAETAWTDARRRTADAAVIDRWLAERPAMTFERRLAEAVEATTRQRRELAAVRERRSAVAARVEAAARDHAPESLQAELAEVEERLGEQLERRRLLEHARVLL